MSHYYEIIGDGLQDVSFVDDIETPAQARKARASGRCIVASVTTKLGYAGNKQLSKWRDAKLVELAREHADADLEQLNEMLWGRRELPDSSATVSSSEFGTLGHEALENCLMGHPIDEQWYPWVDLFMAWKKEVGLHAQDVEMRVASKKYNTAGTIDGIGRIKDKVVLWDYKFRACGFDKLTSKNAKAYPKDAAQLAVEADIVREAYGLQYMPRIYTIVMNADQPDIYPKLWTTNAQEKALQDFVIESNYFDAKEGLL